MKAIHWTSEDFDEFSKEMLGSTTAGNTSDADAIKMAKAGFWFTDQDISKQTVSDRAYPSYIAMKIPKVWTGDFWGVGKRINSIKKAGYDGIILKDAEFGGTSFIAFSPTQIKSIWNKGSWYKTDPRILYGAGAGTGIAAEIARQQMQQQDNQ